jgi:ankyrin repeat protein
MAASRNHSDLVTCLLQFGADPSAKNASGYTPLYHSVVRTPDPFFHAQVGNFNIYTSLPAPDKTSGMVEAEIFLK